MAGGRIYGSVSQKSDAYSYYIDWAEGYTESDRNKNKSYAYAEVHIVCNKHTSYQNNLYQEMYIDGTGFSSTVNVSLSPGSNVILVSGTKWSIYHNNDGSKSIGISASSQLPYGSGWRT